MSFSSFIVLFLFSLLSTIPDYVFVVAKGKLRGGKINQNTEGTSNPQPFIKDGKNLDIFQEMLLQRDLQVINHELGPVPMNSYTHYKDSGHPQNNKGINHDGDDSAHAMDKDSAIEKRIVNGYDIKNEVKYFCMTMEKINGKYYRGMCGATLIADQYVVTAAHCISNMNKDDLRSKMSAVYCNAHNPWAGNNDFPFQIIDIEEIFEHPLHIPQGASPYDIAILKLVKPANAYLQRAKIVTESYMSNHVKDGSVLTVTGMGQTSTDGGKTVHVKQAQVPFVNWHTCRQAMEKWNFDDTMMCAGGDGRADACGGDSGGPLVSKDGYLVGVVSWGYNCNTKGYPGVYADVSQFEGWIRKVTASASGIQFMSAPGVGSGLSYSVIKTTSTTVGTTPILTTRTEQSTSTIVKGDPTRAKKPTQQKGSNLCEDEIGDIEYIDPKKDTTKKTTCSKVSEKSKKLCQVKVSSESKTTLDQICPKACGVCS